MLTALAGKAKVNWKWYQNKAAKITSFSFFSKNFRVPLATALNGTLAVKSRPVRETVINAHGHKINESLQIDQYHQ